ncbi:1066_t:CDS:2 [Racocetra persica]|uniref:1066_t:CDS:1 n=1 Tax=Racocetra persica TaxID=160502 RepID=A0ACA9KLJ5_9GLOM|nr:1066_t:CDS:2 [Racocetra persica]
MTCKSEFKRYLCSNNLNIEKATISFLDGHVKYLQRKFKRSDISFIEYKSHLNEIKELKKKARLLNGKIMSLGNENEMLQNENTDLHSSSLRISEIIDDVNPWKDLISNDEILLKICLYLSSEDLFFSLMQVEKLLYKKLWLDGTQTMWKFDLYSHLTLEQENNFLSKLISTLHSVDYTQLEGSYLDYSVCELSAVSHLVFYFKRKVEDIFNEYLRIPANEKQEWLNKRSKVVREYYNDVLKIKHPTITDQYLIPK